MEKLINIYEEILILHDPLTELLNKGDLKEFINWFNNWIPNTDLEKEELKKYINEILIPKLINYELYEWIKFIK